LPVYPESKFNTLRSTGHHFINFFRIMEIPPPFSSWDLRKFTRTERALPLLFENKQLEKYSADG
jgi:hypothetical protein